MPESNVKKSLGILLLLGLNLTRKRPAKNIWVKLS